LLFCIDSESMTLVLSLDVDNFVASMAERRLSMFGWPRTARPVALDIVFDFVMRDFGGVTRLESSGLRIGAMGLLEGVVAVAGLLLMVLKRAVFSLMVAVSTVF